MSRSFAWVDACDVFAEATHAVAPGEVLHLAVGCDGERHYLAVSVLFEDEDGQLVGGETLADVKAGACDGTCRGRPVTGGFLHQWEPRTPAHEVYLDLARELKLLPL